MASFLDSIGYHLWVLRALLAIPLARASSRVLLPVRQPDAAQGGGEHPYAATDEYSGRMKGDGVRRAR